MKYWFSLFIDAAAVVGIHFKTSLKLKKKAEKNNISKLITPVYLILLGQWLK